MNPNLDPQQVKQQLAELYKHMCCSKCKNLLKSPVRNKRCGHYYCKACIKDIRRSCPECKLKFNQHDLDEQNLARETMADIDEIHRLLLPVIKMDVELEMMILHLSGTEAQSSKTEDETAAIQSLVTKKSTAAEANREATDEAPLDSSEETHDKTVVPAATVESNRKAKDKTVVPTTTVEQTVDIFVHDGIEYHINYIKKTVKPNAKRETPLHLMCKRGQVEQVRRSLTDRKMDLNAQDFAGWTPLHEAIQSKCKSVDIVKELLAHGAIPDVPGLEYVTPLHNAAMSGCKNIIKLLLEYGANKNSLDYSGKTPLEYISDDSIKQVFEETEKCIDVPRELTCSSDVVAFCYHIEDSYINKLKKANTKIEEVYNIKKVTHFILRKSFRVSLKILTAMLAGTIIVPQELIDDFINNKYCIPSPTYSYVSDEKLNKGIQKAMLNSMLKRPALFSGMKFFIQNHKDAFKIHNMTLTKENIVELIQAGGGKILKRQPSTATCSNSKEYPYHSNINSTSQCSSFILYNENNPPTLRYHMAEMKHKSSQWLIDCIINFTIL